jgi:succinyldiaminopimelate transaminase
VQAALRLATDAPGYPLTAGSEELRAAIATWCRLRLSASGEFGVLPTIGSKELVAWLPTLLGARKVLYPGIAYPTYSVGAVISGAEGIAVGDDPGDWPAADLVWLNSPSNPTGRVLDASQMRTALDWARRNDAVIASDECYIEFGWDCEPVSIMQVAGDDLSNVLAVHSMSKRSNLAGYRAAFVAGDASVIGRLLEVRKHAGMIMPAPVQVAMIAALGDSEHVVAQRERYLRRREVLSVALTAAGFTIEHSAAGLYLWVTRGEDAMATVEWFATRGILVVPGGFYGEAGRQHVRITLTATDERIHTAERRLASP